MRFPAVLTRADAAGAGRGRRRAWLAVVTAVFAWCSAAPGAFDPRPDPAAIERAVRLGRSGDGAALDRFAAAYRIPLGDAASGPGGVSLDRLEILTPFRRVVAFSAGRGGDEPLSRDVRAASAMIGPHAGTVSLVLYLEFPPQNVLVTMPRFDIVLFPRGARPGGQAVAAREMHEVPRSVAGVAVPAGSPFVGGSVEAVFDAGLVDPRGVSVAAILQGGRELRRVAVNFGEVE